MLNKEDLGDRDDRVECLFSAVRSKNSILVKILVNEFKFDVNNCKDSKGRTAMHHAAAHGNDLMVYLLTEMSASVNELDFSSQSPLHLAV